MVSVTFNDPFKFTEEDVLALSVPPLPRERLLEKSFTLIDIRGYMEMKTRVLQSGTDDVVLRFHGLATEFIRKTASKLNTQFGKDMNTRIKDFTDLSGETNSFPIKFYLEFRYQLDGVYNKEEFFNELRKVQRKLNAIGDGFILDMQELEAHFDDVITLVIAPLSVEYSAGIVRFQKLPTLEVQPTAEEELAVLERRKQTIDLTDEEEKFILERRVKQRKQQKREREEQEFEDSIEEEPKREGIFTRIGKFLRGIFG